MRSYDLIDDAGTLEEGFRLWHRALTDGAERVSERRWWRPFDGIAIQFKPGDGPGGVDNASVGTDPTFRNFAVEFNPSPDPGNANRPSAIARVQNGGSLWLLRQGWLKKNASSREITSAEFSRYSGLLPVRTRVTVGPTDRAWYEVCPLEDDPEQIREATADFVQRCDLVRRIAGPEKQVLPSPVQDSRGARKLADEIEKAGWTRYAPADAFTVRRYHADIVNALAARLRASGVVVERALHICGYEVDLLAAISPRPLLMEVKTSAAAGDVHTGVGQLMLYRQLFPHIREHKPILLLPTGITPVLAEAVQACGIECHTYEWSGKECGKGNVTFSPVFERLFTDMPFV